MFDLIPQFPNDKKKALANMIYTLLSFIEMHHDLIKLNIIRDEELQALAAALNLAFNSPKVAKKLIKAYFPEAEIIKCMDVQEKEQKRARGA